MNKDKDHLEKRIKTLESNINKKRKKKGINGMDHFINDHILSNYK